MHFIQNIHRVLPARGIREEEGIFKGKVNRIWYYKGMNGELD